MAWEKTKDGHVLNVPGQSSSVRLILTHRPDGLLGEIELLGFRTLAEKDFATKKERRARMDLINDALEMVRSLERTLRQELSQTFLEED